MIVLPFLAESIESYVLREVKKEKKLNNLGKVFSLIKNVFVATWHASVFFSCVYVIIALIFKNRYNEAMFSFCTWLVVVDIFCRVAVVFNWIENKMKKEITEMKQAESLAK